MKREKLKVSASCKEGCPWCIYGSQSKKGDNTFRVIRLINVHKCSKAVESHCVNSRWIGNQYSERYV